MCMTNQQGALQYADRDHTDLGSYYMRHVSAMTGEALHSKSAIAAELAHRDREIDRLQAENANLNAGYAAARLEIESLQARIKTMAEDHADELTVAHLDGRMRAAQPAGAMLEEQAELRRLSDCCPELNLSNYGPDDVDELNGWAIEVSQCIDRALAAQPAGAQQPGAAYAALRPDAVAVLKLALEYWEHRQQRYKNRSPAWVIAAREVIRASHGQAPAQAAPAAVAGPKPGERCQHCIDLRDGFYGSYAPPCPYHDDDGKPRVAAPTTQPAVDALAEAEYFIDNPSAWSNFDQRASDAIAAVCKAFRAARAQADSQPAPVPDWLPFSKRTQIADRHGVKVTAEFNALVRDVIQTYLETHADRAARSPADSVTAPAATVIKKGADRQWMSERLGHLPDGIYSLYLAPPAQAAPARLLDAARMAVDALDWLPTSAQTNALWQRQQPALEALRNALAASPTPPAEQQAALSDAEIDRIVPALEPVSEDFPVEWALWKDRGRIRNELRAARAAQEGK